MSSLPIPLPDGSTAEVEVSTRPKAAHHSLTPPHPDRVLGVQDELRRKQPFKKLTWTHKLAIDMMIEHPEWEAKDLADFFGHSTMWVSLVINSDAFQAKLAERREEILNPEVKAKIEERFNVLAQASIERIHKKLENPNVSDNLVLRTLEISAKALGLGVRPPQVTAPVQIAIVVPPKMETRDGTS